MVLQEGEDRGVGSWAESTWGNVFVFWRGLKRVGMISWLHTVGWKWGNVHLWEVTVGRKCLCSNLDLPVDVGANSSPGERLPIGLECPILSLPHMSHCLQ